MRIAVLSNTTWYLHNFRLNLMHALQKSGYEVFAVGPEDEYVEKLRKAGIPHLPFNVSGDGTNPLKELRTTLQLREVLKQENIDLVLSHTPKGNIYAGLAARSLGIPVLPNVSGLGHTFVRSGAASWFIKQLYRITFSFSQHIFFQNTDDRDLFLKYKLVKSGQPVLLPGSGVDLKRFIPSPQETLPSKNITFILMARLLWDKGIGEYVNAARFIRKNFPNTQFLLLGQMDAANPTAIPRQTIMNWQQEGVIEYLGKTDDVVPYITRSDCVVLPSYYREGTPRSLLEAAAMAKPVITTDSIGCRNVVDDQVNGFLCKVKNPEDLADKMLRLIQMKQEDRLAMGKAGRQKMAKEFDEAIVINKYLDCIDNLKKDYNLKMATS